MAAIRSLQLNETVGGDEIAEDDLIFSGGDASETWVPIYTVFLLTVFQIIVFLIIFETARKSRLSFVFDKKRQHRPGRTPPPLKHRVFEWWRIRLADEDYNKEARQEARARKKPDINKQDEILDQAAQECYSKCSENARILDIVDAGETFNSDADCCPPIEETKLPEAVELGLAELPEDKEIDVDDVETLSNTSATSYRTPSRSPHRVNKRLSNIFKIGFGDVEAKDNLSVSSSARRRPRVIQGTNRVPKSSSSSEEPPSVPRRRQSVESSISAPLGSIEAERLAKLRYEENEATVTWDQEACSSCFSFIKRRILKLRAAEDKKRDDPEFLFHKVVRRKLTMEQQELLRCVGLDAFMTLRFLKFGFDVCFWPFLVALVTLVPAFLAGQDEDVSRAGFFGSTIMALQDNDPRHWFVVLFANCHFCYILRRVWIEWEIFLPLRYDFLENGDFSKPKYQLQYRHTCLVEYVPKGLERDKDLYRFFDSIFPGQVRRAEVLLNTEFLRSLIHERLKNIKSFEDTFAKMVHERAQYLRLKKRLAETESVYSLRRAVLRPIEPKEHTIVVVQNIQRTDTNNRFLNPQTKIVRDGRTYPALPWYTHRIQVLNKEIEDEYLRLAIAQRRSVPRKEESWLSKKLGLHHMMGSIETGRVHSTTAFVEFRSVTAKQQAIQCNLTGLYRYLRVFPCPEIREIKWKNMHVPQTVIDTRKWWANVLLLGCLIAWSFVVAAIRSFDDLSDVLSIENEFLRAVFDFYLPALVVEGLVRSLPFAVRFVAKWIRFKATSAVDHFVVRWYIGFRSITFVFVIVGGTLVDSGDSLVRDPLLSDNVAENSVFFCTYVMVAGTLQCFFRLSQVHNLLIQWYLSNTTIDEATSQRRLENARTKTQSFHLDEFIPLFLFVFMVGALYGAIAPAASLFAAAFFLFADRVFSFMALFIYGNHYEGGGFIFYTLNSVLFYTLYVLVLVLIGYLSRHGTPAMAGILSVVLIFILSVHIDIHRTFVLTSKSLSLVKSRQCDSTGQSAKERKFQAYLAAKAALHESDDEGDDLNLRRNFLNESLSSLHPPSIPNQDPLNDSNFCLDKDAINDLDREAIERMDRRYDEVGSFSDFTESDASGPESDFFIYRQPSLNRATWETAPRPYRDSQQHDANRAAEVWR